MTFRLQTRILAAALGLMASVGPAEAAQKPLAGLWLASFSSTATTLRVALAITEPSPGRYAATMTAVDQDNVPRNALEVTFAGGEIHIQVTPAVTFTGRMSADGDALSGKWVERTRERLVTFFRVDRLPERNRPQEPKPPYPYGSENVGFENAADRVHLAGTLTLPPGNGPHPAVLLISGSGPQDRDETLFGHKPFLVIADYLTRRGVAVLRVDDRGVGESTGSRTAATSENFAGDALAAVGFLASRREIDRSRIGLIGHSEGGLIAPMVATRSRDVAFIVLLAAPGFPGAEIAAMQSHALLKAAGASEEQLAKQAVLQRKLTEALAGEGDAAVLRARVDRVLVEELGEADPRLPAARKNLEPQIALAVQPWTRFYMSYDPRPALRQVRCPVLALTGSKDIQVLAGPNLDAIRTALKEGGNSDATVQELPGLNHLFQTAATGLPAEYVKIEETFAPAALDALGEWILGHVKTGPVVRDQ